MTLRILLKVLAVICFIVAAVGGAGFAHFAGSVALIPAGLALWCGSDFVAV